MIVYCQVDADEFIPEYATEGSSGADLRACLNEPITILPGNRVMIPTGIKVQLPSGYEMQIRSRSGLSWKHGVIVLNSPGTIDADYRGEICVILFNTGNEPFVIEPGMRIAQAVVTPVVQVRFECEELTSSERGSGGFGHTGVE